MGMRKPGNATQLVIDDTIYGALARELVRIYDAHQTCAVVAEVLAQELGLNAIVALKSPTQLHYNAWIARPDVTEGEAAQVRWRGDTGLLDSVIEDGVTKLVQRDSFSAESHAKEHVWQFAERDLLIAPFTTSKYVGRAQGGGVIILPDQPEPALFSAESLSTLTDFVKTFIERALLQYQNASQEVHYDVVRMISNELTSSLRMEEVLDIVANPVRTILDVESVSIGLIDTVSGDIEFVKVLLGPLFDQLPPIRVRKGEGIAGWVVEHDDSIVINDVYADTRFFIGADQDSGFRTESIACVPLRSENIVIGVIEAINKQSGNFVRDDLHLLEAIASPLAIAIQNAELHADVLAEKRRIETIFGRMSEGLLTVNGEGRVTDANQALCDLLQIKLIDILGQPVTDVIKSRLGGFIHFMADLTQSGTDAQSLACDIVDQHGKLIPVLISGAPIYDAKSQIDETIVVFSDLRAIREIERMRDDFFHNIVHELRTPLATILMYARLLREGRDHDDAEKRTRWLSVVEQESDRLQSMVRQMLAIAKREVDQQAGQITVIDLRTMLEKLVTTQQELARVKGLRIESRIDPDLPSIVGDREDIFLVFKNLLDNAIKFSAEGTIEIAAWVDESGELIVRVHDQGIGIAQEAMPNLFKRFYRAQSAVDRGIAGTGLGLYMVRDIARQHGGSIDVESAEGKGTTFTVRLPIVE